MTSGFVDFSVVDVLIVDLCVMNGNVKIGIVDWVDAVAGSNVVVVIVVDGVTTVVGVGDVCGTRRVVVVDVVGKGVNDDVEVGLCDVGVAWVVGVGRVARGVVVVVEDVDDVGKDVVGIR